MAIYPVIMCGGSGTRLWPASRPERPKQFIPLTSDLSSFQATVLRVAGLQNVGSLVIIAGVRHEALLREQLEELGVEAILLLEPQARDSAAAMAAAAAWIVEQDPEGVAVFVSADHDIPDAAAFQAAAEVAVDAARTGRIVTLGVRPRFPSTAFGYIRPESSGDGVRPVAAFVEKPDAERARAYVAEGYLWNSGNFVTAASTLLEDLEVHAYAVADTARQAVATARREGIVVTLGDVFKDAPRISIDYAVMEKTTRASVLPVSFAWADIGAWDAVHTVAAKDGLGNKSPDHTLLIATEGSLIRAPDHIQVAVVGGRNLAVVVEEGSVLVCDMAHSQGVKAAGDHFGAQGLSGPAFTTLPQVRQWFGQWLRTRALPLWWSLGADHERGGYREALDGSGAPAETQRRARVPARQAYVYATAGALGWQGPWRQAVQHGLASLKRDYLRADGLYRTLISPGGDVLDDDARLYDQAFILLALAGVQATGEGSCESEALSLLARIRETFQTGPGFKETGAHPYQSNAMMHLFEAALAWTETGASPEWAELADSLCSFALESLADKDGFIREIYDSAWDAAPGDEGRQVQPGHQFEWAWLLDRFATLRNQPGVRDATSRLFEIGLMGIDAKRGVVVNAVDDTMAISDPAARLWPQTEYLRTAIAFGELGHILTAARAVARYLDNPAPGLWRDEMRADGSFVDAASPTSTLYHLIGVCRALEV